MYIIHSPVSYTHLDVYKRQDQYYMYTNTSWENWGIRLGFNISRVFSLQGKNKAE